MSIKDHFKRWIGIILLVEVFYQLGLWSITLAYSKLGNVGQAHQDVPQVIGVVGLVAGLILVFVVSFVTYVIAWTDMADYKHPWDYK